MNDVFLIRPKVADLVFHLYGKPLHPELFDTLAQRQMRRQDYEVTVRITRTGHVITWQNSKVLLTEIADIDQNLPPSHRLLGYRLRGEHTGSWSFGHGVSYQMNFQVEKLTPEIYLHVHDEILAGGNRGLLHNFQPNHRLAVAPLGFITLEARAGCLFLTSFHTFPEEHTVIKSQSLIEKRG
jgi:hypothetical protein